MQCMEKPRSSDEKAEREAKVFYVRLTLTAFSSVLWLLNGVYARDLLGEHPIATRPLNSLFSQHTGCCWLKEM